MANIYDQFDPPTATGGNIYDQFDGHDTLSDDELDVIARTNNPAEPSPDSFGFANVNATDAEFRRRLAEYYPMYKDAPDIEVSQVARGVEAYVKSRPAAYSGALRALGDYAEGSDLEQMYPGISGLLRQSATELYKKNQQYIKDAGLTPPEDSLDRAAYDMGVGFGSMVEQVGLTMITRKPQLTASLVATESFSSTYMQLTESGVPSEKALPLAFKSAAGQSAIEYIGGRYFLDGVKASPYWGKVARRTVGQGVEESAQAGWEAGVKNLGGVADQTWGEVLNDVVYAGFIGLLVGGPVTSIATAIEGAAIKKGIPAPDAKKIAESVDKNKDQLIAAAAQVIDNETAATDILKDGSREQVKEVIQSRIAVLEEMRKNPQTENPQVAAAAIAIDKKTSPETRAAIEALPKGFTMQQLREAVISKANLPIQEAQAIKAKAEAAGGVVSNDGAVVKYNLLESENSFAVEKTTENRDGSVESSVTQYPTIEDANAAIATAMAQPKLTVEQIASNLAGVAAKSTAASLGATAANRKFYERALAYKAKPKKFETTKDVVTNIKESLDKALAPISTRIRNINPRIAQRLNKFEQDYRLKTIEGKKAVVPFLEKMSALPDDVQKVLDLAMKNGDIDTINNIASKHDMVKELQALRETLDDIYKRAKDVDFDIGFRKNFFPRTVRDSKKLLAYFEKTAAWDDIAQAIRTKELETGKIFTVEEKAHLINTLLRGYKTAGITLAKPGALKERSIEQVTPEIMDFYYPVAHSIGQYIETVNESIEARKFFGKPAENINDSIGAYVLDEMDKGNLTGQQAAQLSDLLKARFNQGKMNSVLQAYKNLSYIDTMGSPISAITQISGLAFSLSNNGFYNTGSALFGKTKIQLDDIGISDIAAEFSEPGRTSAWVKWTFNKVGLSALDRLDKTVFINSTLSRYQKLAAANEAELRSKLEPIFEGETDATIAALKEGKNTENVKLLIFNELTAMQPITLSEMPEMYLNHPNGRIFYMLKTFTLKQYDVYRKQIYQEIASGNTLQGLKNLARLAFFMTLMNAGADFIKDLLLGRDTPMEDQVATNIARLFGFSKYQVYSVKKEGLGTAAFKTIAPPFKLVDSVSKDLTKKETPDIDDLKTIESIPIAGKFWYWWFGGGDKLDKPKYQ